MRALAILALFTLLGGVGHAQPLMVRETNTPIALHYAKILHEYVKFIKPKLAARADVVKLSKAYFDRLGYRVIAISIATTGKPKVSLSWKIPHSKLAVLPRMTCYVSAKSSTVELYDQGDDYVRLQNFAGQSSSDPQMQVSLGITHRWR